MRTVTVTRDDFIKKVSQNRETHRAVFEQALEGYRKRLTHELEQRIKDLQRGRRIDHHIGLPLPEDHTEDYDRVLQMATMSIHDTIELTEDEFGRYVMDQWHWKQDFADSTELYR
jgi:hypothetical protein